MPVYCYLCPKCEHKEEQVRPMREYDLRPPCPSCGMAMGRDIHSEHVHTDTGYQTPILSSSLGVPPDQIKDAQRRFPHHRFAPDGRMILSSHGERKKVLRELGFYDKG